MPDLTNDRPCPACGGVLALKEDGLWICVAGHHQPLIVVDLPIGGTFEVREDLAPDVATYGRYHVKAPGGHEATAELEPRELVSVPGGTRPLGRPWTRPEIMRGVAHTVQLALVSPPEKKPGHPLTVDVGAYHLYEANGKL